MARVSIPRDEDASFDAQFFSPRDFTDSKALIVEPLSVAADQPSPWGLKDKLFFKLTQFANDAALESGTPNRVVDKIETQSAALVNKLRDIAGTGGEVVVTLDLVPTKNGNKAWVWNEIHNDEILAKVDAYMEARDGGSEDDEPPF